MVAHVPESATMPKERPKTRKERREAIRQNYLAGKVKRPYSHTPVLDKSLEEDESIAAASISGTSITGVCSRCLPVLSRYKDIFQGLTQHGSKLKKCKKVNSHPKLPERAHYRDLVKQNDWIRMNLLDGMGNLLFCSHCICSTFKISPQHLSHQCEVKRLQFQQPVSEMTKQEVEQRRLGEYVVMPEEINEAFLKWWRSIDPLTKVKVRVPPTRHGLAGKTLNSAKTEVLDDFFTFVDSNSQPNGRAANSIPTERRMSFS